MLAVTSIFKHRIQAFRFVPIQEPELERSRSEDIVDIYLHLMHVCVGYCDVGLIMRHLWYTEQRAVSQTIHYRRRGGAI